MARCMYDSPNWKCYKVSVDQDLFPDVKVDHRGETIIKGRGLIELSEGVIYKITGIEEYSDKYNSYSYDVKTITANQPKTPEEIESFLTSVLTERQAAEFMREYPDIIDIIKEDRCNEIDFKRLKGITENNFERIKEKIQSNFLLFDICDIFGNIITLNMMYKILEQYPTKELVIEALRSDPYDALISLSRVGFKTADDILLKLYDDIDYKKASGIQPKFEFGYDIRTSKSRCMACIMNTLYENENDGNTKISFDDIRTKVTAFTPGAAKHLESCLKSKKFYVNIQERTVSRSELIKKEMAIYNYIKNANNEIHRWDFDTNAYAQVNGFMLTPKQQSILNVICNNNIAILSGNSGSGKSSCVRAVLEMARDNGYSSICMSPTAKAAKVLREYTGDAAYTIHRALGYNPESGWQCNHDMPIGHDLVIVDECSMVDTELMYRILDAINFKRTKLLFIGDPAQLPSVGPGNCYFDLINSGLVTNVFLDQIFRYNEDALIQVATDTRQGRSFLPDTNQNIYNIGKSFIFCEVQQESAVDYAVEIFKKRVEKIGLENIVIISSYNKGDYGTSIINSKVQKEINPQPQKNIIKSGFYELRIGDIVMQNVNDYRAVIYDADYDIITAEETTVVNGEQGVVYKIVRSGDSDDSPIKGVVIKFDDEYIYKTKDNLNTVQLAYAISCHKSQGSGYKEVIVLVPRAHTYMLSSNLLYVAFTRCKERLFVVGEKYVVNRAITRKIEVKRSTNLSTMLAGKLTELKWDYIK